MRVVPTRKAGSVFRPVLRGAQVKESLPPALVQKQRLSPKRREQAKRIRERHEAEELMRIQAEKAATVRRGLGARLPSWPWVRHLGR